jgi:hypothetical protein
MRTLRIASDGETLLADLYGDLPALALNLRGYDRRLPRPVPVG